MAHLYDGAFHRPTDQVGLTFWATVATNSGREVVVAALSNALESISS